MQVIAFPSRDALFAAATQRIADALTAGIAERGTACAALSGGSTPEPIYRALSLLPLNWPNIAFTLVDERFVPNTDVASNEGMIKRALAPAFDAGAHFKPMYLAAENVEAAADNADALYALLAYDIALIGMGEDGHTASWFPDADGLREALESKRAVIAVHAPQAAGAAERLTLTRAALTRAKRMMLVITGDKKREVLEGAIANALPVAALFDAGMPPIDVLWAP